METPVGNRYIGIVTEREARNMVADDEKDEGPQQIDLDEFGDDADSSLTVACPKCREQVYEDAPQCPECGTYLDDRAGVWEVNFKAGRLWMILTAALLAIMVLILALI
jgi:hypothetical protein